MYTILTKLNNIEEKLNQPTYRGGFKTDIKYVVTLVAKDDDIYTIPDDQVVKINEDVVNFKRMLIDFAKVSKIVATSRRYTVPDRGDYYLEVQQNGNIIQISSTGLMRRLHVYKIEQKELDYGPPGTFGEPTRTELIPTSYNM
tara:strand:+ start:345 stop:773 length:429 start_codon:yes stop_codon:yes gene_type:complete